MSEQPKVDLKQEILQRANDGKISCSECMSIAEEFDCTLGYVGKTADDIGVKIVACQLGCF